MKTFTRMLAATVVALCALFLLPSCATTSSSARETPLLSEAGFTARTPETAKQRELYDSIPARQLQRAQVKGKVYNAWKDDVKGVVWIGDEDAYQRYRELALQRQIAEEELAAATMSAALAWG